MLDPLFTALEYLRPAPLSFWQWQDAGQVIAWTDGTTLAFLPGIAAVFPQLRLEGVVTAVPLVNLALAVRCTLVGDLQLIPLLVTGVQMLLLSLAILFVAGSFLGRVDLALGARPSSLKSLLQGYKENGSK